jgi:hypothetical protein
MTSSDDTEHKHVYEIRLAKHGDHSSHENELTIWVVADSRLEAADKACDLQIEGRPDWHTADTTWACTSVDPLNDVAFRQFINETQDDVLVGGEVPV